MTDEVDIAAMMVRSEAEAAGKHDEPEWLAVVAMNHVQSRVRGWREDIRFGVGAGFTQYPPAILALGAGYCGSQVVAWRAVCERLGIITRELGVSWDGRSHVCGEASWAGTWHFFDVSLGTVWVRNGVLLAWRALRALVARGGNEKPLRVTNQAWLRWSATWADPFAYLHDPEARWVAR